jgi:hypothetical protein
MRAVGEGVGRKQAFFFEKKNQKTFGLWGARCDWRGPQGSKVFCFFFSKKKSSFYDILR